MNVQFPSEPWSIGLDSEVVRGSILVPEAIYPTLFSTPGMFAGVWIRARAKSNSLRRRIDDSRRQLSSRDIGQDLQVCGVEKLDSMQRDIVRRSNIDETAVDAARLRDQFMDDIGYFLSGLDRNRGFPDQRTGGCYGIDLRIRRSAAGIQQRQPRLPLR